MVLIVKTPVTDLKAILDLLYIHLYFAPVKLKLQMCLEPVMIFLVFPNNIDINKSR